MSKAIDARNLSCPQPVVLTKKALEAADEVTIIVDNEAARDNVSRLGASEGCEVSIEAQEDGIYLTLKKVEAAVGEQESTSATSVVLLVASDVLGRGDNQQLGSLLIQSFLHTVGGLRLRPETIIFINTGVFWDLLPSPGGIVGISQGSLCLASLAFLTHLGFRAV